MNRRRFIAGAAALLPLAAGAAWLERRGQSLSPPQPIGSTTPGAGAPASPPPASSAVAVTASDHVGPGSAALGGEWQPRYHGGLPRRAEPGAARGRAAEALAVAERHIVAHCTNPAQGNAMVHGVRALGRRLPVRGGDPYRVLLETYTRETYIGEQVFLEVPARQEGHRHAMLKTLVESRCELDLRFEHDVRAYTFADYVRSARILHTYDLKVLPIDEQSWTILALVRMTAPADARWSNVQGHTIDLERMIDDTAQQLWSDTRLVRGVDLAAAELPVTCDAFKRACGGVHMLYALAAALASGYDTPQRRTDFAEHLRTHLRRFTYDLRVIDHVEQLNRARGPEETARIGAFDGRLKFLGHSLEIVSLVDQYELYAFNKGERAIIDAAREALYETIIGSATLQLQRYQVEQVLFESLVTGMCHAYNGILMSLA